MNGIENYSGFLLAALILNITPGADTLYVLTRSMARGKLGGLVSVAGISTGCVVHLLCATLGLSAILSASALAFNMVKWAGAAYLIFLGLKALTDKNTQLAADDSFVEGSSLVTIYRQGILTNVLNPKVALFFISFLPHFINSDHTRGPLPFLLLGGTFLCTGALWLSTVSLTASSMGRALKQNAYIGRMLTRISGVVFIGFGLKLALDSR